VLPAKYQTPVINPTACIFVISAGKTGIPIPAGIGPVMQES